MQKGIIAATSSSEQTERLSSVLCLTLPSSRNEERSKCRLYVLFPLLIVAMSIYIVVTMDHKKSAIVTKMCFLLWLYNYDNINRFLEYFQQFITIFQPLAGGRSVASTVQGKLR
jgi:hypothetical protein